MQSGGGHMVERWAASMKGLAKGARERHECLWGGKGAAGDVKTEGKALKMHHFHANTRPKEGWVFSLASGWDLLRCSRGGEKGPRLVP